MLGMGIWLLSGVWIWCFEVGRLPTVLGRTDRGESRSSFVSCFSTRRLSEHFVSFASQRCTSKSFHSRRLLPLPTYAKTQAWRTETAYVDEGLRQVRGAGDAFGSPSREFEGESTFLSLFVDILPTSPTRC